MLVMALDGKIISLSYYLVNILKSAFSPKELLKRAHDTLEARTMYLRN
jgi:hypothetical protein